MALNLKSRPADSEPEKFAVYVGDGAYVSSVHLYGAPKKSMVFVYFGASDIAASLERVDAVRVCRAVRRAGVPAWVVNHPVGALS